eukprot:2751782-Prymnesium_polylepis.1
MRQRRQPPPGRQPRRGGRLPWKLVLLRTCVNQLGVSGCEALAQSQISMPWTATGPQDHVGDCASQPKRNVTPARRHATGSGRPKASTV